MTLVGQLTSQKWSNANWSKDENRENEAGKKYRQEARAQFN